MDIIQLRESILPVLTLGRGSDQEASSSGVSVCEDCPWIWGKIHVVEERRGRGETPRGSKAFLPPDSCLQQGEELQRTQGPEALLPAFRLGAISRKSLFPRVSSKWEAHDAS